MYGAFLGDMIGAPYEFDRGKKTKEFPLFSRYSEFSDDSVMTTAVAEALLDAFPAAEDQWTEGHLAACMHKWGRKYPNAGYGGRFHDWLLSKNPKPYGSYGNGSAMRVSSAGWLYDTLEKTEHMAELTAKVTHNHPEGIKGAVVTAGCIFLARKGAGKREIRAYAEDRGYDLSRTCDQIRPYYHHVESCQKTVPEAITAFLEGTDFEDVIRTAVSLGGDCDTLTCIAGSIAEAFYGVPDDLKEECRKRLPNDILRVLDRFEVFRAESRPLSDASLAEENDLLKLFRILRGSRVWIPCTAIMSDADYDALERTIMEAKEKGDLNSIIGKNLNNQDDIRMVPDILQNGDEYFFPVFTTVEKMGEYGEHFSKLERHFLEAVNLARNNKKHVAGIVINPFSEPFVIPTEMFEVIEKMEPGAESVTEMR